MLCECGCGQKTNPAAQTNTAKGWRRGEPQRFIRGHANRLSGIEFVERDCGYYTPCYVWQRATSNGYGVISIHNGRRWTNKKAHVVRWEAVHGPVPPGLVLDHLCCNNPCVREDHLEPVTQQENLRRGHDRGLRVIRALVDGRLAQLLDEEAVGVVRDIIHGR